MLSIKLKIYRPVLLSWCLNKHVKQALGYLQTGPALASTCCHATKENGYTETILVQNWPTYPILSKCNELGGPVGPLN
jgi:hypothetical protein